MLLTAAFRKVPNIFSLPLSVSVAVLSVNELLTASELTLYKLLISFNAVIVITKSPNIT
jgi:hypothetical protein